MDFEVARKKPANAVRLAPRTGRIMAHSSQEAMRQAERLYRMGRIERDAFITHDGRTWVAQVRFVSGRSRAAKVAAWCAVFALVAAALIWAVAELILAVMGSILVVAGFLASAAALLAIASAKSGGRVIEVVQRVHIKD